MFYGRYHVAEPYSSLARRHVHQGGALRPVDHEPAIPVLNQGNLLQQGIHTSELVPGAKDRDGLGSCVYNATAAHLSERLSPAAMVAAGLTGDPVADEKWAILAYHEGTDLTGNPATEWPPHDCGSNGLHACQDMEKRGLISTWKVAHTGEDILSMLQDGSVLTGQPWFRAWEEPNSHGFIDGDGSHETLARAVRLGLAGGHETCWTGIEQIRFTETGDLDPGHTIIRFRNSWSAGWGESGTALVHLSTYLMLAPYCDFRQMHP